MNLPPLSALEVLETLARTGSISQTAREVHLSQSAISHKMRTLEAGLGFKLTKPRGRGVVLTAEARRYVAAIGPGLQALRDAHRGLGEAKGRLAVACSSGIAATWLSPRIGRFLNLYPEISLSLISVAAAEDVPDCDLFMQFTSTPPPGAQHLLDVVFFPVCSPDFLYASGGPSLSDLTPDMLLHLDNRKDWAAWLALAGSHVEPGTQGVMFTGLLAMYAAAEAGLGICLGDALTCGRSISTGRLVRPFPESLPPRAGYWITPPPGGLSVSSSAFVDWLRSDLVA
ncbi:MAG: LysR substrate-binding domain-containing protein [Paracoccaceae bacterium]